MIHYYYYYIERKKFANLHTNHKDPKENKEDENVMLIYICDDNKVQLEEIRKLIEYYFDERNIGTKIKTFNSYDELYNEEKLNKIDVDLYFMDVDLHDKSGIDLAELIFKKNTSGKLIYISAYKEYVFDVFRTNPADYLVKPIEYSKLEKTLNRVMKDYEINEQIEIVVNREKRFINLRDIRYIEGKGRKLIIHAIDYSYEIYKTIEEIYKELNNLSNSFVRIHMSYIVNYEHIVEVTSKLVKMDNGANINISRKYKDDFNQFKIEYMKKKNTFFT